MVFADLNNRHVGETAYLIGTGPSLDDFDLASVDGFQIAIHRVIGVIDPKIAPTYWQVLDDAWTMGVPGPWHTWRADMMAGNGVTGLFRDPLYMPQRPFTPAPQHPNIVRFGSPCKGDEPILTATRDELASRGELYTYAGSGCTAVHAAWYMGARRVVLIGLDGRDGYARCLWRWYDRPARGGFGYGMARECLLETAQKLDMEIAA